MSGMAAEGRSGGRRFYPVVMLVAALAIGGGFLAAAPSLQASRTPPVPFDHSRHVRWGLHCRDCHAGVERGARAMIPRKAVCRLCHSREVLSTPGEADLVEKIGRRDEPLLWPEPRFLPSHVIFSHRRHVVVGKVGCERCHGDMANRSSLPLSPTAGELDMSACIECHQKKGARSDCFDCHR